MRRETSARGKNFAAWAAASVSEWTGHPSLTLAATTRLRAAEKFSPWPRMSAKKAKKSSPASAPAAPASGDVTPGAAAPAPAAAWIDSDDPKKRQWAKVV